MPYTVKVIRVRPNLSIPFVDPNDTNSEGTPVERQEYSDDGLTNTTYFKYDQVPSFIYDWASSSAYEKQYDAYLKQNNITRQIIVTNDTTGEVVKSFYTWQ
jgi:hypothetical protein